MAIKDSYDNMLLLMANMTMAQATMKERRILAVFSQCQVNVRGRDIPIYKLANDIEYRLTDPPRQRPEREREEVEVPDVNIEPQLPDHCEPTSEHDDHPPNLDIPVDRDMPFMLPANMRQTWSAEEEGEIPLEGLPQEAYQLYLRNCFEKRIAARTFNAFKKRRAMG